MSSVLIQVRDNETGSESTLNLGEFDPVWSKGVLVGGDSSCDIVLPGVAGKHVRIFALSNHKILEVLEGEGISYFGEEIAPGESLRIDGLPFQVGQYTLRILGAGC